MALTHDGHAVTCATCRTPLRASLVAYSPLLIVDGVVTAQDVAVDFVECDNCGSDLGTLDEVGKEYARRWAP